MSEYIKSAVENATEAIMAEIDGMASTAYATHNVSGQHEMKEEEFRRMLAFYFHGKSLTEWAHDLHIPAPDERT